jgi:hypothetical protein
MKCESHTPEAFKTPWSRMALLTVCVLRARKRNAGVFRVDVLRAIAKGQRARALATLPGSHQSPGPGADGPHVNGPRLRSSASDLL